MKALVTVARIAGVGLYSLGINLTGDLAGEIIESANLMSKVTGLPMSDSPTLDDLGGPAARDQSKQWITEADLELLHDFYKDVGLAPKFGGMKFVKIRNKGWLWVTPEEAEAHAEEVPHLAYLPDDG